MNPWNFFTTILFINLPSRGDRLLQVTQELTRVGINNAIRIPGLLLDDRIKGFNQSQRNALEACKGNSLILEDDVAFRGYNFNTNNLSAAFYELPYDWDLLYLGANIIGNDLCNWPTPLPYSQHLRRIQQAWTTHAIAYSEAGAKKILKDWDYKNGTIYDDYLRQNLEKLQAFIINPMIADQRAGFSDIWQTETNYGFFHAGNQRMA